MISKDELTDLLPFYAMDAVTDEERRLVEAYFEAHPEARDELDSYAFSVEALAESIEPIAPSDAIRDNLMTWVDNSPKSFSASPAKAPTPIVQEQPKQSWWSNLLRPALAGSMALAAFALIWGFSLLGQNNRLQAGQGQLEQSFSSLQAEVASLETGLSDSLTENEILVNQNLTLQEELDEKELQYASLLDPSIQSYAIAGTEAREEAFARFVVNEADMTAFLSVSGLESLDESLTYQFWLIDEEGPVSAGLFTVDESGETIYALDVTDISAVAAVGVSIEPAGGSEQPTGDIVLLGEL